ncbi:hypothetical protein HOLleu_07986 [Holothuria leucospilota]|uniref:Uncharacterized protein n=1 Tax=Holothuria leucospilota TaxID=206669 RepID=A0A9Q1HGJ7_HOLLE|nr:hypothetical protein HOLleu_07986 [Holothuria leucospilota]
MPQKHESTVQYASRLREKAADCNFDNQDERILEHIIQTIPNEHLITKAISKKWDLPTFLKEAAQLEETKGQVKEMRDTSDTSSTVEAHKTVQQKFKPTKPMKSNPLPQCLYCGLRNKHPPGKDCPAYGQTCRNCGGRNHFAKVCRKKSQIRKPHNSHRSKQTKAKKVETESNTSSEDDEYFEKHLNVRTARGDTKCEETVLVHFDDVGIYAEPDSGATGNIMDEHQFKAFKNRTKNPIQLQKSKVKVSTLQGRLKVKGEFETMIQNQTRGTQTKVIVVRGRNGSPPLLCKQTLLDLGMLKIDPTGRLKVESPTTDEVHARKTASGDQANSAREVLKKYDQVFQNIGCMKGVTGKFTMKPNTSPVAQRPRHVPYYLQKPLKEWFRNIPKDKLKPNQIRASIDLRVPNKCMERNRITPAPIVEDFMYKFHDCKVFSKLDMRQGYHQLMLDPTSREIATFSTPWGNMRPKRLVFGAKSSQDLFDEAVYKIFGDIPHVLNQRDDILLGGRTLDEHNETLSKVLGRAAEHNITFNREKCEFGVTELEFYGYKFTKDGLKATDEKIRAVKEAKAPRSKEAVRSFLGMLGYLSKFIPNYADLTAPLRELTHQNVTFKWEAKHSKAFQALKDSITSDTTMAYFDPRLPIIVRTEASFNEGLSAGLFQKTEKGIQPVHYVSRTLTETEKRYSQTEKDALAVKWAKDSKATPRIEKWVMDMQNVDYEMVYEPGRDEKDPLDFLSRHPMQETDDDETELNIKQIVADEHSVVIDKILKHTKEDNQLQKVKQRIKCNDWDQYKKDPDIMPFYHIRDELYEAEGLVFRLHQIIIPTSLQRKVVKVAHNMGHLGMTKTKKMLRAKYWFPGLGTLTEKIVGQCFECGVTTKEHRQEPIKTMEIPDEPWDTVAIDFGGPYPDGHYNLVVIDKRSRYPEVERLYSTEFKPTRDKLKKIFANQGIPKRVETDNGPPFSSKEFAEFASQEGFTHHPVTPEHARANGEAESFMKLLNKTEQIAHLQGRDTNVALQEMLMGFRSTPHPATGETPYRALNKRTVRTKLDHSQQEAAAEPDEKQITENDKHFKQKSNEKRHRNVKEHTFVVGDYVLLRQQKRNKWSTAYEPAFYVIYRIDGSSISARRVSDGRQVYRDASKFKQAGQFICNQDDNEDWREKLLRGIPHKPDQPENYTQPTGIDQSESATSPDHAGDTTVVPKGYPKCSVRSDNSKSIRKVGQSVTLTCDSGFDSNYPTIRWMREERQQPIAFSVNDNTVLEETIQLTEKDMDVTYTCILGYGSVMSAFSCSVIPFIYRPRANINPNVTITNVGENVTINCSVSLENRPALSNLTYAWNETSLDKFSGRFVLGNENRSLQLFGLKYSDDMTEFYCRVTVIRTGAQDNAVALLRVNGSGMSTKPPIKPYTSTQNYSTSFIHIHSTSETLYTAKLGNAFFYLPWDISNYYLRSCGNIMCIQTA